MLEYRYELLALTLSDFNHGEMTRIINGHVDGRRIVSMTQVNGVYTFLLEDTYDTRELSE